MNTAAGIFAANSLVWPLSFILISLLVLRQLRDDVRPIFNGMVGALSTQATRNAVAWAVGIMMGTLASLQAMSEVAHQMQWPYIEALAKILQPGLAAVVAYIMASPTQKPSSTTPPFPNP